MSRANIGLAFDDRLAQYDLGEGHPFRGDRFRNAMEYFRSRGLFDSGMVELLRSKPVSREDLLRVHDEKYVDLIFRLAEENKSYDPETPTSESIVEGALLIAGGGVGCAKAVLDGTFKHGVSLGGGHHHAGRDYGGGFCLFNDVAVLIEFLRAKCRLKRFLVLDYDVHFGNGTSDIYYRDNSVLYISLHQDPRTIYPGRGFVEEIGEGDGTGFNVCVPLPVGTGDETYLRVLEEVFVPLAEEFKPEIIVANGGSDAHFKDSLGSLGLTARGFYGIACLIRKTAERVCNGRLVLIPGSGYNPRILPMCWYSLVAGVAGLDGGSIVDEFGSPVERDDVRGEAERTVDGLKRLLRKYWTCFEGYAINDVP